MAGDRDDAPQQVRETTIISRLFNVFEITLLFGAAVAGAIIAVTVGLTKSDFEGGCILFAQVTYTSRESFRVIFNPSSFFCDYCIILQVILAISAMLLVMLGVIVTCKKLISPAVRQRIRVFSMIPFYVMTSFAVLVQAVIITAGLNTFCRGLLDGPVDNMSCQMFQSITWDIRNGSRFHDLLFKGMIASWSSFFIWVVLTTSSCIFARFSKKPYNELNELNQ